MPTILDEIQDHEEALQLVTQAKKKPQKRKPTMQPPDNERRVLTWTRDWHGVEGWQIDSYSKNGLWIEADAWEMEVLWWQELPPKPDYQKKK